MEPILIRIAETVEVVENNYQCRQGDTFPLNFTFKDAEGQAIDITGWEFSFIAKQFPDMADDDEGVISATPSIVTAADGTAEMELSNEDTEELVGTYFYTVQYTDDEDRVKTFMSGRIVFTNQ